MENIIGMSYVCNVGRFLLSGKQENVPDGWCRVTSSEGDNEIILVYGTSAEMTPVAINDTVTMSGRLHCLADVERYAGLSADDMDITVEGCLVYGMLEDGSGASYNTNAESLWQTYSVNKE